MSDEWQPTWQGRHVSELPTPSMLLDLDVVERNVKRMAEGAKRLGVRLRPHFKTSRCLPVAALQEAAGCDGFTVSNLDELRVLAASGRRDLTWAYPVILTRLGELIEILGGYPECRVGLVVDSEEALGALASRLAEGRGERPAGLWIKVDCGYHRVGVDPESEGLPRLVEQVLKAETLEFRGILSHSGHSYHQPGRVHALAVAYEERDVMVRCAEGLRRRGLPVPEVSVGSTPAMSALIQTPDAHLGGITEARPGNYVFYDGSQVAIGSCGVTDCALTVLSSVVSCSPGASHAVIDAGALSLSKDPGPAWVDPPSFGLASPAAPDGESTGNGESIGNGGPNLRVVSLSQEHGRLSGPLPVGSRVRVLANHSCLTVPHFRRFVAVRGERVVGTGDVRPLP